LALAVIAQLGWATFPVFTAMLALTFAMFGLIASNFNALAMEPVGRVAGSASAIYGAVTATGGAIFGALIARAFDGTVVPFAIGLAAAGAATLLAVLWTERGALFGPAPTITQKP
jgi:DHA1 family bicyclomycin/chloramphenicol resistance-like MFS transporter